MLENTILLTTPTYPYPTLPANDSLTDATGQRFTHKVEWTLIYAMDRFAPNGVVRRRVRKVDEKFRQLIGEPTPVMETLGRATEGLATAYKARDFFNPQNRHPKEEPYKRYVYDRNGSSSGAVPYRTKYPGKMSVAQRLAFAQESLVYEALTAALKTVRFSTRKHSDPDIDDHLVQLIETKGFGF